MERWMFVWHFVDPDLGLKKRGQQRKTTLILEWSVKTPATYQYSRLRKISSRGCLVFLFFSGQNLIAFKCPFHCKFCYQETFCVFIYSETVYILSYTDVLHANIFSPFSSGNKFTDSFVFPNFLLTLHTTRTIKESKILRGFIK